MVPLGYKSLKAPYFSVAGKFCDKAIKISDEKNWSKKPFIGILGFLAGIVKGLYGYYWEKYEKKRGKGNIIM